MTRIIKNFKFLLLPCVFLLLTPWEGFAKDVYVNDRSINIRSGPGLDYVVTAVVKMDQTLKVLGSSEEWLKVLIPSGKEGWIAKKMVRKEKPKNLIIEEYKETMLLQKTEIEKLKEELAAIIQDKEKLSFKLKELKLNHNQLLKDIEKLEKSKETVWIAGSIVAALVIWLLGFLAGHFRIVTENKRLHQMTLTARSQGRKRNS